MLIVKSRSERLTFFKHYMTFNHEKGRGKKLIPRGQFSTPLKIAQALVKLASISMDFKDKIIFEPCVGTGNLLIPFIGKGAILIGSDIDQEALEICKQRVPEAILTNCNTLFCYFPHNKSLKYGRYCSEHIFSEPPETVERLERILQQRKENHE